MNSGRNVSFYLDNETIEKLNWMQKYLNESKSRIVADFIKSSHNTLKNQIEPALFVEENGEKKLDLDKLLNILNNEIKSLKCEVDKKK